jgi:hypothetical protein
MPKQRTARTNRDIQQVQQPNTERIRTELPADRTRSCGIWAQSKTGGPVSPCADKVESSMDRADLYTNSAGSVDRTDSLPINCIHLIYS